MKSNYSKTTFLLIGVFLLNFWGSKVYKRFDLTEDSRYSLSKTTVNIANKVEDIILIKVYLQGDFPADKHFTLGVMLLYLFQRDCLPLG